MTEALAKGSRITGAQRATLSVKYAERYAAGESIRKIAEDAGRSFGFVHGVLKESGVGLRGRGGATRGSRGGTGSQQDGAAAKSPTKTAAKKKTATGKTATGKAGPKKAAAKEG